jgi:hypothetical protein
VPPRSITDKTDGGEGGLVGSLTDEDHSQKSLAAALKVRKHEIGARFFEIPNGIMTGRNTDSLKSCFAASFDVAWCIANDEDVIRINRGASMPRSVLSRTPNEFSSVFGIRTEAAKRKESI